MIKSLRNELKLSLTERRRKVTNNFNKVLNMILRGNPKQYFNKIKSLFNKKGANGLPKSLKYKDKVYTGSEVLKGFYDLSKDQSINPKRVPGNDPLPYYNFMRDVVNLEKYLLEKTDKTFIKPFDNKGFNKLNNKVARGKAQDVNGMAIEHLLYAPEYVKDIAKKFTIYILEDFSRYSTPLMSLSVSNFLYKGKNKPKDLPGSYRKITIGNINQKIVDTHVTPNTGKIAKKAQPSTQYRFTEKTNYLICSILRETLQTYSELNKVILIALTSDMSNAFSRTDRISQIYELILAGEFGKYLSYSYNTYTGTITLIKGENEFTDIIIEWIGARQGALKSAPDFKLYNIPLHRLINTSNLGFKIFKTDVGLLLVADDSMSLVKDNESLLALIELYVWYSFNYAVDFAFSKTVLNVFGLKEVLKDLKKDEKVNINGQKPLFDEITDHLGLKVCQDTKLTPLTNVQNRIEKTNNKTFVIHRNLYSAKTIPSLNTSRNLYLTYIRPSLTSGLNALVLDKPAISELAQYEKELLRALFKCRDKATVKPLYKILGIEPIEINLKLHVLTLFHNLWTMKENEAFTICKMILEKECKGPYWINLVKQICTEYEIGDPLELLKMDPPKKNIGKNM